MKKFSLIISIILILISFSISNAKTEKVIDIEKLSINARNEILNLNKSDDENFNVTKAEQWASFGKNFASALKETCQVLNVEVNAFVKTPVGMVASGLIVYKVIGKDLIKMVVTILVCSFIYILILFSFFIFFIPKKLVIRDENKKITQIKYIKRYEFKSDDARVFSAWAHGGALLANTFVLLIKF
jgi:hypothetical protein